MRVLFSLGHPAHYHLFKNVMAEMKSQGNEVIIAIKSKDVLEELVASDGWTYHNILPKQRKSSLLAMAHSQVVRNARLYRLALKAKPTIMLGTSVEISHVGSILRIPSIVVGEDDSDVVPKFAWLAYPLATHILAPSSCEMGRWSAKTLRYDGFQELAYLHPNRFTPNARIKEQLSKGKPYYIIRFAKLTAHHDKGISGLSDEVVSNVIALLREKGNVYITSERPLDPKFEEYRIDIHAQDMHHALYFADLYIGDSQTMAAEAAVLGTPSLRVNDFVGRIGYLEELESKFGLTIGVKPAESEVVVNIVKRLIDTPGIHEEWSRRRNVMLSKSVDTTKVLIELISGYPASVERFKDGNFVVDGGVDRNHSMSQHRR